MSRRSDPLQNPCVSEARRIANRRNARKSTGPKTADGKRRSAMNSIGHGLFCRDAVLPGEKESELLALRIAFHTDLRATDMIEYALVERLVMAQWRMIRAQRAEAGVHNQQGRTLVQQAQREMATLRKRCDEYDPELPENRQLVDSLQLTIRMLESLEADHFDAHLTLASDIGGDHTPKLERLGRYAHRLLNEFDKTMRELRRYRDDRAEQIKRSAVRGGEMVDADEPHVADLGGMHRALLRAEATERAEEEGSNQAFDAICDAYGLPEDLAGVEPEEDMDAESDVEVDAGTGVDNDVDTDTESQAKAENPSPSNARMQNEPNAGEPNASAEVAGAYDDRVTAPPTTERPGGRPSTARSNPPEREKGT